MVLGRKIEWCCGLKDGLKIVEPNERIAQAYLSEARGSLERAEKNFKDKDFLWATVVMYYAEYYALYSFLQKIGVNCENHACSILATTLLLGDEKTRTINEHKGKRIDAQYYIKVDQEIKIRAMLQEAKRFVSDFDERVSRINETEIKTYRETISKSK